MSVDYRPYKAIKINAPDWFKREDFSDYVRRYSVASEYCFKLATWHTSPEVPVNECSDVFEIWDRYDGTGNGIMPDDIWEEITDICAACGLTNEDSAIIWITNLSNGERNKLGGSCAKLIEPDDELPNNNSFNIKLNNDNDILEVDVN